MSFNKLIKFNSLSKVCNNFVTSLNKKYNNKITAGEYIVERLIKKNINIGFRYELDKYTPFLKATNNNNEFEVVFNDYEKLVGYNALSYAKNTDNIGLMLSSSTYGFSNYCEILDRAQYECVPLLLMSFHNPESVLKISDHLRTERRFLKNYHYINNAIFLPNLLEYILTIAELPKKGPVQLNICNDILDNIIDFNTVNCEQEYKQGYKQEYKQEYKNKQIQKLPDMENLSLLQQYENIYEKIEQEEQDKK